MTKPSGTRASMALAFFVALSAVAVNAFGQLLEQKGIGSTEKASCLPQSQDARRLLEKFLFPGPNHIPLWANARLVGAENLTLGLADLSGRYQIERLRDPDYSEECRALNERYAKKIADRYDSRENGDVYFRYEMGYFTAGDYFFVVMSLNKPPQPDDPGMVTVTTGYDYVDVLDKSMVRIRRYGM